MKKIYLLCTGVFLTFSAFSQSKQAQTFGFSQESPNVTHDIAPRGGSAIFSEDFAGGIPSDWDVSTTSGPVNWKHTLVGHTGDYPTASLNSTTNGNGWVIADSDGDNFSGGGAEDTRLITSRIDLTGYNNVKVEFQQMFRRWQQDITTVQISLDSVTWTNYIINGAITQAGTPNPDYVNIDISSIAANEDSVWISFWWQGAWDYGWQIDDIAVKEILDNDITMKNEKFGLGAEYYMTPLNQVQPYFFSVDVENIGMLNQTSIELNATVNDGTTDVYMGSSATLASLVPWAIDSLGLNSGFTVSSTGNYTVTFNVNQAETDQESANNTRVKNISITDTTYALDNGDYQGQWYNQEAVAGNSNPYVIGAIYDIYTTDVASSISAYIGNNTDVGTVCVFKLFEFDGLDWILIQQTDDIAIGSGDLGTMVTAQLQAGTQLTAGNAYMAGVEHLGGPDYLWVGYSSNVNPGYTASSDDGFAFNNQPRNPMIRLNFGSAVGIEENVMISTSVYPNPATDKINIQLNDFTNVKAELIDITGKVVMTQTLNNNSEINVGDISRGIYTLRLVHEKNVQTIQVVLTK